MAILERDQPVEQVPTKVRLAVFAVMSPEDRWSRVLARLQAFKTMGVPQKWVVYPATEAWRKVVDCRLVSETGFLQGSIHFQIHEIATELDL